MGWLAVAIVVGLLFRGINSANGATSVLCTMLTSGLVMLTLVGMVAHRAARDIAGDARAPAHHQVGPAMPHDLGGPAPTDPRLLAPLDLN